MVERVSRYGWLIIPLALPFLGLTIVSALDSQDDSSIAALTSGVVNEIARAQEIPSSLSLYNSQTLPLLRAARNQDPNPAKGGGDITVVEGKALLPETGPYGSRADIEDRPPSADEISVYIVREGDNLSQIAEMFGVTSNTIRWANDIGVKGTIQPGQTLVILPVVGVQHTIEDGDTLKSLAKKYDADLEEMMQFNGLEDGATLALGEKIMIPGGEVIAPKPTARTSGSRGATSPLRGASGPSIDGYYIHPVPGSRKSQGLHGYNALDFAAPIGTPIRASASGKVIISRASGWNGGYGNYIVVDHPNGTQTLYSHLSQNIVWVGQHVVQGQVLGYMGSTGRSTGPHLHFEVRGAKNPF